MLFTQKKNNTGKVRCSFWLPDDKTRKLSETQNTQKAPQNSDKISNLIKLCRRFCWNTLNIQHKEFTIYCSLKLTMSATLQQSTLPEVYLARWCWWVRRSCGWCLWLTHYANINEESRRHEHYSYLNNARHLICRWIDSTIIILNVYNFINGNKNCCFAVGKRTFYLFMGDTLAKRKF